MNYYAYTFLRDKGTEEKPPLIKGQIPKIRTQYLFFIKKNKLKKK